MHVLEITYAFHLLCFSSRNESAYIHHAVNLVAHYALNTIDSFGGLYTESIISRALDVIQLLKQTEYPLLLGIWGMAGIGKTQLARTVYDQIGLYFEDKSFVKVNRLSASTGEGPIEEMLLFDTDKETELQIFPIESGKVSLKERLKHKRVLLILDGVDTLDQLKALCGNRDWFAAGSKIIITARDRNILKEHAVDHIYRVKELDESESLEVFNWDAFIQETCPAKDFVDLSRQVVAYSGGLPLALKSLGRFLHGKKVLEWNSVLKSLEIFSFPDQEVLEALEKSFSSLSYKGKQIFFDIACFFHGMDQNDALQRSNRSIQSAALQIPVLEDKSLVTINKNNKLEMHVLLRAAARDIIKRESSNKTNQVFCVYIYDFEAISVSAKIHNKHEMHVSPMYGILVPIYITAKQAKFMMLMTVN